MKSVQIGNGKLAGRGVYATRYFEPGEVVPERPEIVLSPGEHSKYGWKTIDQALRLKLVRGLSECILMHNS